MGTELEERRFEARALTLGALVFVWVAAYLADGDPVPMRSARANANYFFCSVAGLLVALGRFRIALVRAADVVMVSALALGSVVVMLQVEWGSDLVGGRAWARLFGVAVVLLFALVAGRRSKAESRSLDRRSV